MEGFAGWISAFVGVAILLSIAPIILGNATFGCEGLPGYNTGTPANSTGWAQSCLNVQSQTIEAFDLLVIILIVLAAAVILRVVGFIGG